MRLTHPTIRPTGRPITFRFNDQTIAALHGETIAAALAAAGVTTFRHTPTGAPRGLFCGMGACFDCVVTVDGRIGQRACLTQARDAMTVASDFPATLAVPAADDPPPDRHETCDVLVIGAGPAGLSAAIAAAEAGATVVILDERTAPGGQYARPLAPSHTNQAPDAPFQLGHDLHTRAIRAGVRLEPDAVVWGAFAPDEIAAIVQGQAVTWHPSRLILATGAHEAPVPIPAGPCPA